MLDRKQAAWLAAMGFGLAIFNWGGAVHFAVQLHGLLLFGALALMRPHLALLWVPFTVPLYLMPVTIGGLREEATLLPLHEAALLITAGATAGRALYNWATTRRVGVETPNRVISTVTRAASAPVLLLAAGVIGVLLAVPEGRGAALRDLRWLIIEPLIFYALVRRYPGGLAAPIGALLAGGTVVAALGILQFVGIDLVPFLGAKQNFGTPNVVEVDGLRRVTSVYGHPNNLGLYLGRIWPLAAALALTQHKSGTSGRWSVLLYSGAALLALAGVAISFSRGAWLAAVAAGAVLAFGLLRGRVGGRGAALLPLLGVGAAVIIVLGLGLSLRGGLGGGSVDARVLLWREAVDLITTHPLGLGLDQFYFYHNPEFGRSRIDPRLIGTSEQYAAHPHNLLLEAWLNVGPLGLFALGWAVWRAARTLWRDAANGDIRALGALAALTAAIVHGLVDQFYFVEDLALAFWLIVAIASLDGMARFGYDPRIHPSSQGSINR